MTRERLDRATPEQRHRFYGALGIRVEAGADRSFTVSGNVIIPEFPFESELARACCPPTNPPR
jgi:hypothetical protein